MKLKIQSIAIAFALTNVVFLAGCGVSLVKVVGAPDKAETKVVDEASSELAIEAAVESAAEAKEREERTAAEKAAMNGMINEIIAVSKSNPGKAKGQLNVLFAAADEETGKYAAPAKHAADRVIAESINKSVQQFAKMYLIRAKMRDEGFHDGVMQEIARFANNHPTSGEPLSFYQRLSDQLVYSNDAGAAIGLLQHGIRNCKDPAMVRALKKQKQMTQQTIALLGQTVTTSVNRPKMKPAKPSKTSKKSDYYGLIGKTANICGSTLLGRSVSSGELRGNWVYVHFWATWCGACRTGVPAIVSTEKRWSKKGVKFVGVNMDNDQDAAKKFMKDKNISWPQISSGGGWGSKLAESHDIKSIPTSFLVAPNGKIIEAGSTSKVSSAIGYHLKK